MTKPLSIHHLGLRDYLPIRQKMQDFTQHRQTTTEDQIWLLQHSPVFTRGSSCRALPEPATGENEAEIPVVQTDRGGQMTYHGPGQLIAYLLLDIKRRQQGVKSLVKQIEQAVIDLLDDYDLPASRRRGAPGVYVGEAKIAALGLRIKRGCCFHGLSLNVDMDLRPYQRIDPCGYPDLVLTQMSEHVAQVNIDEVETALARRLLEQFG